MPPVSVTMHALNLPAVAALVELLLPPEGGVEAEVVEPHAASSAAMLAAAAVLIMALNGYLLDKGGANAARCNAPACAHP
jgi:hypothetical protein